MLKLDEMVGETMDLAERAVDYRVEAAREQRGMPTWLAASIDAATIGFCAAVIVHVGGFLIIPALLFGSLALLEMGNRVWRWAIA